MGERVRFLAEPRNDNVNGLAWVRLCTRECPMWAPPRSYFDGAQHERPLGPRATTRDCASTREGERPLLGMDSGSGAGMTG